MANTTTSANMALPIPVVGQDPGPTYGTDQNNCFTIIDAHDHTTGNGVQITPAGINVTADFPFNGKSITNLFKLNLAQQSAVVTDTGNYSYNVLGDLYWHGGSGNVQITSGSGLAGTPGSISNLVAPASASYTAGSKLFTWLSGVSKAAAMDNGAITIRETDVASAKGITLKSPVSLGADYSLTLFSALPVSTQYVNCDSSGGFGTVTPDALAATITSTGANTIGSTMTSTGANAIGASMTSTGSNAVLNSATTWPNVNTTICSQVANGRLRTTGTTVSVGNVAVSNSSSTFSTTSTSPINATNLNVTITVDGSRPVIATLVPDGTTNECFIGTQANGVSNTAASSNFYLIRSPSTQLFNININSSYGATSAAISLFMPPGSFSFVDATPSAGTYTYTVQAQSGVGTTTTFCRNVRLCVYEL